MSDCVTKTCEKAPVAAARESAQERPGAGPGGGAFDPIMALHRGAGNQAVASLLARGSARPLDDCTRQEMESRFGQDFSGVRIHNDEAAAKRAFNAGARAVTTGHDIVFGPGFYAPESRAGKKLIAHELAHVIQQNQREGRRASRSAAEAEAREAGEEAASGRAVTAQASVAASAQADEMTAAEKDRKAMELRLSQVRARLAQLRGFQRQSTEDFTDSLTEERQRQSVDRAAGKVGEQTRTAAGEHELWGGRHAGSRIRKAVSASVSGHDVTLSAAFELQYKSLSETEGRKRSAQDLPRIVEAITKVWQVTIEHGDYAGVNFRVVPSITYLPPRSQRSASAFLIEVRGPDSDPSTGESTTGTISLALAHLEGDRVIVVAHELAHLFGFTDAYFTIYGNGPGGKTTEVVGRSDPQNRADLLGFIDPVGLQRMRRKGTVSAAEAARQSGQVRVWEEEAGTVLRTLGVAPPKPPRPEPDSEDFDPEVELNHERGQRESELAKVRARRAQVDSSIDWVNRAEEVIRLEAEERQLNAKLGGKP